MKVFLSVRTNRDGFTLIETLVVVIIILGFLAMSIPFFANFSTSTGVKSAEREIKTLLNTARSYAVSQNQNFNVVFNASALPNTYSITDSGGMTVGKIYPLPKGVTFAATSTITFAPNGGLDSGNSNDNVTINGVKPPAKTITVNRSTGTVK